MRQVPAPVTAPFGIVGDGRLARHLNHYLVHLGLSVRQWSRRAPASPPPETLASCDTILLLISDKAIAPFVDAWPALRRKQLVHCAGGLRIPEVAVAHPLLAFGPSVYDAATYRAMPFIIDADGPPFAELLPGLPNPSYRIPPAERAYYHALCVMAGNFSTLLWQKLQAELTDRFQIPAAAAHPYLRRVAENLIEGGTTALTGPLARGDTETIAANLGALEGDPYKAVYAAFVKAYEQRS